ncbi:MAG: YhjD/YihY/BrkB family envelope integrity protein [Thiobacillus sp.]|nr:YhjD/YihY/BrkB family envelope integrity protein [Thiobacillus sp.]
MNSQLTQETRRGWSIFRLAARKFLRIDGAAWAGAFAFNAFFSLFPLMVLLVTIASAFIDRDRAATEVIAYVETFVPLSGDMQAYVFDTIAGVIKVRGQAGAIALLILVWVTLKCFTTLISATNRAWDTAGYSWWRLPLKSLMLLGITAGVVLLSIGAPMMAQMARDWLFPINDFRSWVYTLLSFFIPLLVLFFGLSLFYRLAPRRSTNFSEVWVAALSATAALAGGRKSIRALSQAFRHVKRGLWDVRRDHGLAAMDLSFREHFHIRRLPVRRAGRSAFSACRHHSNAQYKRN